MAQASKDAWDEFHAMTDTEVRHALAYVSGLEPHTFERVIELSRARREQSRLADLRYMVSAACQRERDAEVTE
jgi:hypothetical protein